MAVILFSLFVHHPCLVLPSAHILDTLPIRYTPSYEISRYLAKSATKILYLGKIFITTTSFSRPPVPKIATKISQNYYQEYACLAEPGGHLRLVY